MMLLQAAADDWKVPVAQCTVAKGVIAHATSKRTTTYGKMCGAAAKLTPPKDVMLKDAKDWKIAGKRLARLDTINKTNGKQIYGMDLVLPGMLNAAVMDCPVFGGKLKSVDDSAVLKRAGVRRVLKVGDTAVAVIATTWWQAKTALDALKIEWDEGPNAKLSSATFAVVLKEGLTAKDAVLGFTINV